MPSIILAIPQYNELKPLIDSFDKRGHPSNITQIGVMEGYTIPSMGILAAICGHGKTQFGIQVQYLIDRNPESKVIFCIGAAGHLTNQCKMGDIVIGISTIEYDYKLRFIQADPPCHRGDNSLIEEFRKVTETDKLLFKVHFGNIASGDEDIVDQTRAEEINRATNALCVAWEGSGGARAAAFNNLKYLEIRCITDESDYKASESFHANCEKVIPNISDLLIHWWSRKSYLAQHAAAGDMAKAQR